MNIDPPFAAGPDAGSTPLLSQRRVMSVGELARSVAGFLEKSFPLLWVSGEISNLMRAASGHWYFSLKDRDAQLRCVMFRSRAQGLDWAPRDGDRVEARVIVGLYAPRGDFQLQVEQMRRAGAGLLYEEFLRIKARLEAAGLFARGRKRPLPAHPRRIGLVTSLQAAALRDVLTVLARRAPHVEVVVYPTPVQGESAPLRIVEALATASWHGSTHDVDVVLLVRGGGSIEDLWAFNDERVAHAIVASLVPVVSGVGHETDFTIADFVADLRAATPTAAAELATPDAVALRVRTDRSRAALQRAMERLLDTRAQRIDEGVRRLRSPAQRMAAARARLDALVRRMQRAGAAAIAGRERPTKHLQARLVQSGPDLRAREARAARMRTALRAAAERRVRDAGRTLDAWRERLLLLDPKGVLDRGYAIVTDEHGRIVRDARQAPAGTGLSIELARGRVQAVSDGADRAPA